MKIIFWIILLIPITAYSQINCESCKQEEYPFLGCKNGIKISRCSSDPNNDEGFRPWKKCLNNLTITYDSTNFPIQQNGLKYGLSFPRNDGFAYHQVFTRHKIVSTINQALNDWLQPSCYPNINDDNCQPCNIKVRWAREVQDMREYPRATSITIQETKKPATGACDQNCDSTEIRLNGTPEWTGINPNDVRFSIETGSWTNFFRTDHDSLAVATTNKCYDFRSVMRHEIGHWLGFGDMVGTNRQSCSKTNSVMDADDFEYDINVDITSDDRCMFTVLYCCPTNPNTINEAQTINSTFNLFPNPTTFSVTIALSPSTSQYSKHLRVVDMTGNTVSEQKFQAGGNHCIISTAGLSAGTYLFVLTFDGINGSFAQKVVVQ
jgi:hypothetical protein